MFSRNVPAVPAITYPTGGTVVSSNNLIVSWEQVTHTLTGKPVDITGYEIIITYVGFHSN
jgi:hypothetical protein